MTAATSTEKGASGHGRPMHSADSHPPQSITAMIVDLAVLGAIVAMAIGKVTEPAAWTLLGGIVSGRFGVSLGKTIERVRMGGGSGGDSGEGGGTGRSGSNYTAIRGGPPIPREDPPSNPRQRRVMISAVLHDFPTVRAGASALVLLATVLIMAMAHAR